MARLVLPDPPPRDDVIALRGLHPADAAALVDRPECAHMPDIYFARLRPAPGG